MAYTADYSVPYIDKLSAMREKNPPHWWNEEAFQLPGGSESANILNDPAFSLYDFDKLRTFEDDPYMRDLKTLGLTKALQKEEAERGQTYGYTYKPDTPTDSEKIYVDELGTFKNISNVPIVEQENQVNINKELANTIAHEFRHNLFQKPEYKGIIEGAYDKFGRKRNYDEIEEMINTAADVQLNEPGYWPQNVLDDFQDEFNVYKNNPEFTGYEMVPTTSIFNNSATAFFDRVRQNKIKQKQAQIQSGIPRAMISGDGRVFNHLEEAGGWSPSGADLSPGGGYEWKRCCWSLSLEVEF